MPRTRSITGQPSSILTEGGLPVLHKDDDGFALGNPSVHGHLLGAVSPAPGDSDLVNQTDARLE